MCKWFCRSLDPRPRKTQEILEDPQKHSWWVKTNRPVYRKHKGVFDLWFDITELKMLLITFLSIWVNVFLFFFLSCIFNSEHRLWDTTELRPPLQRCQISPNLTQPMEQRLTLKAAEKTFKENVCVCVYVCWCVCARAHVRVCVGLAGTRVWRSKGLTFNRSPGACGFSQMPNGHMI